jgi:O-antigen ligase
MRLRKYLDTGDTPFWPLMILAAIIGLVPFIIYLHVVEYPEILVKVWGRPNSTDFFSYYRSWFLHICSAVILVFVALKERVRFKWSFVPLLVYALLTFLSAVFAKYPILAMFGEADRHEGLLSHLSYMVVAFSAILLCKNEKALRILLSVLLVSASVLCVVGIFQFFDHCYFFSEFGSNWLVPSSFKEKLPNFSTTMLSAIPEMIFLVFGNGNFTGSYMTMVFLLSLVFLLIFEGRAKYFMFLLNLLVFFNLMGSKSRAGQLATLFCAFIALFIMRKKLYKNIKWLVALAIFFALIPFIMDAYNLRHGKEGFFSTSFMRPVEAPQISVGRFDSLKLGKNSAEIIFDGKLMKIVADEAKIEFFDETGESIPIAFIEMQERDSKRVGEAFHKNEKSGVDKMQSSETSDKNLARKSNWPMVVKFPEDKFRGFEVYIWLKLKVLQIGRGGKNFNIVYTDNGFKIINIDGRMLDIVPVESWGFKGREAFASRRGYIWSRTLPLLKNALLLGYGPDTFVAHFPQHDVIGKLKAFETVKIVIEKPHSLYIQIAYNSGVLCLLTMLCFWAWYLIKSLMIYFKSSFDSFSETAGFAIAMAVMAYLIAGIFNDSIVGIAPVFWALLGMGIATNEMNLKARQAQKQVV